VDVADAEDTSPEIARTRIRFVHQQQYAKERKQAEPLPAGAKSLRIVWIKLPSIRQNQSSLSRRRNSSTPLSKKSSLNWIKTACPTTKISQPPGILYARTTS